MLKLAGSLEKEVCPTCQGRGSVIQPDTQCVRTGINGVNARGPVMVKGGRVPCSTCKGKKVKPQ